MIVNLGDYQQQTPLSTNEVDALALFASMEEHQQHDMLIYMYELLDE